MSQAQKTGTSVALRLAAYGVGECGDCPLDECVARQSQHAVPSVVSAGGVVVSLAELSRRDAEAALRHARTGTGLTAPLADRPHLGGVWAGDAVGGPWHLVEDGNVAEAFGNDQPRVVTAS